MDRLTTPQVLASGLSDWRKLAQGLHARFDTADLAAGAAFLAAVATLEPAGHVAEARVGPVWVELTLTTHDDGWWVTTDDVDLARTISRAATDRGLVAQSQQVTQFELALDSGDGARVAPFWSALLTGSVDNVVHDDVMDPQRRVPNLWFQETEPHETPRQRFHIDLWLAQDVADERIAAAVAAGGAVVDDSEAPSFVVLADPDGNRACVCTALNRQ